MKRLMISIFLGALPLLYSCSLRADSNIFGPKYHDLVRSLEQLAAENPLFMDLITYGKSVQERPLVAVKLHAKAFSGNKTRPAIVITEATHGWEYLNLADRLPQMFLQSQLSFLNSGGVFYIVPVFNPDAYESRKRYNANEFDLNRDFPLAAANHLGRTQPETSAFLAFLENEIATADLSIRVHLDYHCCGYGQNAEFAYPWSYLLEPTIDHELFQSIANNVAAIFESHRFLTGQWSQVIYQRTGTANDYFYSKHKSLSFIIEGAWDFENQRLKEHLKMWEYLIGLANR